MGAMGYETIRKGRDDRSPPPRLLDYTLARTGFSWERARAALDGLPSGTGLNIAHEAVDRHARSGRIALRWLGKSGERRSMGYAELAELSSRFANALRALGVQAGDRVCTLLGRVPELYVTAMGTLKNRSVFCPLFSAFGPEPIKARLQLSDAKVLVTTPTLYRRKVSDVRTELPALQHVLLVPDGSDLPPKTESFTALLAQASPEFTIPPTTPEDPALLHFTSGTTGKPKGALHVHGAVIAHHVTGALALDLHEGDVFWCTADPGWVTGTSYGVIAPLTHGCTLVVDEDELDAERWYRTLAEQKVNVWYTAPTAVRMLMKAGDELPKRFDLSALRFVASVGEPLNPEGVIFGQEGELALRPGWPSMFRTYLNDDERYKKCFAGGWYLTGDLAKQDADGYFWFVGRADDMIKSAGHLIGPFEVESALLEHPAVAEAAVIGKPDPTVGQLVKAFVSVKPGHPTSDALAKDILAHARKRLGAVVAPKELAFLPTLPRTRSGKLMRRLLKARELGLPEGDTSTLEAGA